MINVEGYEKCGQSYHCEAGHVYEEPESRFCNVVCCLCVLTMVCSFLLRVSCEIEAGWSPSISQHVSSLFYFVFIVSPDHHAVAAD